MFELTEGQKKTVASGLAILSLTVTLAFVAAVGWALFKVLAFASSALIPVIFGFFLALCRHCPIKF